MAVNKVEFGGNTLIDLTEDTLESAEQLLKGIIAHAKDGSVIEGVLEAGGGGLIAFSTITPTESVLTLTFEHNLGAKPNFIFWVSNIAYNAYIRAHMVGFFFDNPNQDLSWKYCAYKWTNSTTTQNRIRIEGSSGKLGVDENGYGVISYDEKSITFGSNGNNIINFISGKNVAVITGVI